ncbi:hypothetical protein Afil01_22240 [Actinorhabdospora filicis]|uniref:Pyrroloquinoline-quinone binding quinoprotein n=1 Tax=Actinorhabdospora filicis TaxID=1785913 RepID=A0A9W6SKC8_9ACTN|nr:hypothetical protein Afil01_22240 [Actinorhabdospora filicis]
MVAAVIVLSAAAAIWITTLSATAAEPKIDWRVPLAEQQTPPDAAAAGDAVVMLADGDLTVLDAGSGAVRWTVPDVEGPVRVAADSVVYASGALIKVHDLAGGQERFSYRAELGHNPPFWTATPTTLVTVERDGKYREAVATSLTTGKQLWHKRYDKELAVAAPVLPDPVHTAMDASPGVQVAAATSAVYLNTGLREAGDEKSLTLDIATGTELDSPGTVFDLDTYSLITVGDRVVSVSERSGCETKVVLYDPLAKSAKTAGFGADCNASATTVRVDGGALIGQNLDGRPEVVDVVTGEPRWTADARGVAQAFREPVLAYSPDGDDQPLKIVDVSGGPEPWQARDTTPAAGPATLAGKYLLTSSGSFPTAERPDDAYATTGYNIDIDKLMWHQPGARLIAVTEKYFVLAVCGTDYKEMKPAVVVAVPYT